MSNITLFRTIAIALAAIQVFDILIHAVTNQLEIIRVASNLIILVWLALLFTGRLDAHFRGIAIAAIGSFLALNLIFLARAGVTNPAQGGELRILLLLLVGLTTLLSVWLMYLHPKLER